MFQEFLQELGSLKNQDIPFQFRNQFKIKENFINPNSKHFDSISSKLLSEEKAGIKRKWDKQCKMMFIWVLGKFFQMKNKKTINPNQEEWTQLANILQIDELTLKQRWITLINPISKSINWDPEEDEIIRSLMNEQDEKHIWTTIALELYNQNNGQYVRTPKQVRERWMNYLNPKLRKTNWNQQEDLQLLNMVVKNGKRWSLISTLLEGRTENQVKNRFKSLIQKIYKDEDDDDIEELQAIKEYLIKQNVEQVQEPQQKEEQQARTSYQRQAKQKAYLKDYNTNEFISTKNEPELPVRQRRPSSQIKDYLKISNLPKKPVKPEKQSEQNEQKIEKELKPQKKVKQEIDQVDPIKKQQVQPPIIENKKDLSTPNTLSYYFQPQLIDELKNDQFRLKQVQMSPAQNQMLFQSFRPYQEEVQQQQIQQTPAQMLMGQYFKNQFSSTNYNLISPFPQIGQTPMQQIGQTPMPQIGQTPLQYTPAQPMYMYNNNQYMGISPLLIRSPYQENMSPSIQAQQPYWQNPQPFQLDEKLQQTPKVEFIKPSNLLEWKNKRNNEKQSYQNFDSLQQFDQ